LPLASMPIDNTHLYWLILACEVGFWLLLGAALFFRYIARMERVSWVLLVLLPVLDLLLLAFTAVDLRSGQTATFAHGLATTYVGFTVAFGGLAVGWADQRFAHRFANGPPPTCPPKSGWAAVQYELGLWLRCIVAAAIICVLVVGLIVYVDNDVATQHLRAWFRVAIGAVFFWFVFGPLWSAVFHWRGRA
jgi:hypothetical protein